MTRPIGPPPTATAKADKLAKPERWRGQWAGAGPVAQAGAAVAVGFPVRQSGRPERHATLGYGLFHRRACS
jgi:hypothetical protein